MKTALIVVDVQRDFCPGGALAVDEGDHVVAPINRLVRFFEQKGWPVFFTRDWHPANHCSFNAYGGEWPPHCIADSDGAGFHDDLYVPDGAHIISKGTTPDDVTYSNFEGTTLEQELRNYDIESVIIGGLATDYCVKHTALDAHRLGFKVTVAIDAVRAVNVKPEDGRCAIKHMQIRGINFADDDELTQHLMSQ